MESNRRLPAESAKASTQDSGKPQGKHDHAYDEACSCPRFASVPDYGNNAHCHRYGRTEHDQDSSKESEG